MASVFDRLSNQLSGDERRAMLKKIDRSYQSDEQPMHREGPSADEAVHLDEEFKRLSLITRLGILVLGFLSGRRRNSVTQS